MRDKEDQGMGRMETLSESQRQEDNIQDDRSAGGSSGPSTSSERFDSGHPNQYERHDGDTGGMTDSSGHSGDVETRDFNHADHRPGETASMGGGSHHMSSGMGAGGAAYSNMSSTSGPSSQEGIRMSEEDQMQTGGGGSGQRREFGSTGGAGAEGEEGSATGGNKISGTPEDSSDQMQTGGGGSGQRREFGSTGGSSEGNEG